MTDEPARREVPGEGADRLYRVIYEIDIDADSPEEAAFRAWHYMTDAESQPPAFTVMPWGKDGPDDREPVLIDLSELDAQTVSLKAFKVAAVSENTNSFGLYGHVLVARDGESFQAGASIHRRRQRGDIVRLRKPRGAQEYVNWAELGFEIPEPLPACPAPAVREIWSEEQSHEGQGPAVR